MTNFLFMLLVAFLLVVLYETEILTANDIAANQTMMFGILVVMELTTILVIPMALKLFSLKVIRRKLLAEKGDALLFWGTTRINMLCLPMLINTFMYYQTMSPAFGYMAIILVLCLFFVYPSISRYSDSSTTEGVKNPRLFLILAINILTNATEALA